MSFKITDHVLVPEHIKLNDKDKEKLLERYNITLAELPKISTKDPAIQDLNPKPGDIIKVIRKSVTAKKSFYYRVVI